MARNLQINATKPRVQYRADGIRSEFPYPFPVFSADNLEVYVGETPTTDGLTFTGVGESEGGTVVFSSPPSSAATVTIRRRLELERTTNFLESGPFRASVLNDELDYLVAAIQQIEVEAQRTVRLRPTDGDASLLLPLAAERAGRALVFDGDGGVATAPIGAGGEAHAWKTLDDIPDGVVHRHFEADEKAKLQRVEDGAQINPRPVTADEKAAATETAARTFSPRDVADMVTLHAPAGGGSGGGGAEAAVASVFGRTGAIVAQQGDYTAEQIAETDAKVVMTAAERTKLGGVEVGAQVNTVASVNGRTGAVVAQVGDYTAEQIAETAAKVVMTAAERTKLGGIAAGAQVNPVRIPAVEKTAGTATTLRGFAAADVRDMVAAFAPAGAVTSVAGRTGAVTLAKDDVGLANVTNDAQLRGDLGYTAKGSPAAGDKLLLKDKDDGLPKLVDWSQLPSAAVASVNGRTGAVTAQAGDYTAEQITDTAAKVLMTAAERTKLGGVATGAQVNPVRITAQEKTDGTSTTVRGSAPLDIKDMIGTHGIRAALDYATKPSPAAGDKVLVKDQADGSTKLVDWNAAAAALKAEADPFPQYTTSAELAAALATKADAGSNLVVLPVSFAASTLANVPSAEPGGISRVYLDLSQSTRTRMSINIGVAAGSAGQVARFEFALDAAPTTWLPLGPGVPLDVAANAGYTSAWADVPAACKQAKGVWVRVWVAGVTPSSAVLRNITLLIENAGLSSPGTLPANTPNTMSTTSILDVTGNTTDLLFGVGPEVVTTLRTISARTVAGTCTIAFKRDTTPIADNAGKATWAIDANTPPITLSTTTPQSLPAFGKLYLTVTGANALAGLIIVVSGVSA